MARAGAPDLVAATAPRTDNGRFASEYPTDGRELLLLWEMPGECIQTEKVKVARYIPGSQQTVLVAEYPMLEFNLGTVTRSFGPGRYMLKPGPGQYSSRSTTLNVAEEYARANGWREVPAMPEHPAQPSASDAYLMDRMARGTREPLPPLDMAMVVEMAVQKALAAQAPKAPDPTQSVMSGFELAMTMMDKARNFVNPAAAIVEKEPASLGDALMAHGPQLLGILQQGLSMLATPKPAAPAQPRQALPPAQPLPPVPATPATQPEEPMQTGPKQNTEAEARKIAEELNLDQATAEAVQPIMAVLTEFAPKMITFLRMPIPADVLGGQLAGMIGPDLEDSALVLAEIVKLKGPAILGLRYPELATEKAAEVVKVCAARLREERGEA